jgi:gamma-glutamyltranspeptidase / glutathione hydrolase / leukotriene-C4 hydrolase
MIKSKFFIALSVILLIAVVAVASVLTYILLVDSDDNPADPKRTGAISSNSLECATMGRRIFEQGGNVADAAVTVVICEGIACPQSAGIGGGLALMIYLKDQGVVRALNAQERAPGAATADMFKNASSVVGGKSVAVPGELRGLWELHQRYGKLPWKDLLKPNIELCREGHLVSAYFQRIMASYEADLLAEPSLREIFINPATGKGYQEGDRIKRLKLADTLEVIAEQGVDAFYGGEIGRNFIADVRKFDGIMTLDDLVNYK